MKQTTKATILVPIFMLLCATLERASARSGRQARGGRGGDWWPGGGAPFPSPESPVTAPTTPDTPAGGGRGTQPISGPTAPTGGRGENGEPADPPESESSTPEGTSGTSEKEEDNSERKRQYLSSTVEVGNHGTGPASVGKHVGAYFPSYNKESYPLSAVDMSLYSDAYFFTTVTTATSAIALDPSGKVTEDDVTDFVASAKSAGTRPSLAIGGWSGSVYFSSNVATAANRTAFVRSVADFYNKFGFEGVDVDWEYPSTSGIGCNIVSPNDTANLVLFLQELRTTLPCATLSMAVSMTGMKDGNGERASDMTALAEVLDYVNVMTYDAWGSWSATTGPLGPLSDTCANDGLSVEKAVQIFLDQHFKASQLVVGIPAYGRSSTLLNATLTETTVGNQTSLFYQAKNATVPEGGVTDDQPGTDVCGAATAYGGSWLVSELVSRGDLSADLATGGNGFTRYFDECSGTPFLFNNQTLKFIAYDDVESSVKKAEYVKSMGLKGVFFFDTAGALPAVVSSVTAAL